MTRKILELFSGTGSVGKIASSLFDLEVISVDMDRKEATHTQNILDFDYTQYPPGHFEVIWASPPCAVWSRLKNSWIGRTKKDGTLVSKETIHEEINRIGKPIVDRTLEIIDYFKPLAWFIENPAGSKMKDYITGRHNVVISYCRYSDWGYQKNTRIWTNVTDFVPRKCCSATPCHPSNRYPDNPKKHKIQIGHGDSDKTTLYERYRIPPKLIYGLLKSHETQNSDDITDFLLSL